MRLAGRRRGSAPRVLFAVSGTGGHVYPGIAVAEELVARRPDVEVLFAVAAGKPGSEWIRGAGFETRGIPVRGFARRPGLSWLTFPFRLGAGVFAAVDLLATWRPSLVVGTGGYVVGPFLLGSALLGLPLVLLEQNAIPGVTTRLGSIFAREVHLAVPESRGKLWRKSVARTSGNPVRRAIEQGDGDAFRRALAIPPDAHLIVVIGGSQGAKALTEAAIDAARRIDRGDVRFVVQTGTRGIDEARARAVGAPPSLTLAPYLDDMGGAYAAADLVVSRSGAMTLAELAASGVPSVLVPYPFAAEDHQTKNAQRFAAQGSALVIPQHELTGERLAACIEDLLADPDRLARMGRGAGSSEESGARQRIAEACERFLG